MATTEELIAQLDVLEKTAFVPKTLFGVKPETEKKVFPRAAGLPQKTFPQQLKKGTLGAFDVLSILGRGIASAPTILPGGESPSEAFARKGAPKGAGKFRKFTENIVRDPITLLTLLSGGAAAPAQTIGKKILSTAGMGAARQILPAGARQLEQTAETGEFKPVEQAIEAGKEIALGAGGEVLGAGIGRIIKKGGKSLFKSAAKIKDNTARLAGRDVESGINKIADDVVRFKLDSPTSGMKGVAKNAQKRITKEKSLADKAMNKFIKQNPDSSIDVDEIFLGLMDDIENGKINSVFGEESAAAKQVANLHRALELRGLTGNQPVSKIPEIKRALAEGTKLFKKGKFAIGADPVKAQAGELVYLRMNDELGRFVPEVNAINRNVSDLINVKRAAIEANKRMANWNKLGLTDIGISMSALLGGGVSGLPPIPTFAAAAGLVMVRKGLGKGRGTSLILRAGRITPTIARTAVVETAEQKRQRALEKRLQSFGPGL